MIRTAVAVSLVLASSASAEIAIDHKAVGCVVAGKFPKLDACFTPGEQVARARVYFRPGGGPPHWYFVEMKPEDQCFTGILPRPKKELKALEYYVQVLDKEFAEARTAEYAPEVVAGEGDCRSKLPLAPFVSRATVVVGAPAGASSLPLGFAAGGVAGAGASAAVVTAAVVGGGAAVAGTVAATTGEDGGGGDSPTATTAPPTTTTTTTLPVVTTTTQPGAGNRPPAGVFVIDPKPAQGASPLLVSFSMCKSSDPDGDPLSFSFDFGDSSGDSGTCRVEHTYTRSSRATLCVNDGTGLSGHEVCESFDITVETPPVTTTTTQPPGPNCSADRTPPTASVVAPQAQEQITSASYTIQASASDSGSGVARVRFYADQLNGPARFSAEDTTAPYTASWPVPSLCGELFAVAIDAEDNCGNLVSPEAVFVVDNRSCSGGARDPLEVRTLAWTSVLDVPEASAQMVLNGRSAHFATRGQVRSDARPVPGENRIEAFLVQAKGPGTWRFELGRAVAPGSIRVIGGSALGVGPDSVTFRMAGTPGERVSFVFRVE